MRRRLWLLLLCLYGAPATAQDATPPAPIVRATVDPQRVVVGQETRLQIEVLAPNYMTKPPVLPEFQLHNAVTIAQSTRNTSERQGETTFAGVVYTFSIYPQEPGSYAIAGQEVAVSYAAEPPASREARVAIAPLAFEASIPDAAQALDPFVAATTLSVRQEIQQSSAQPKTGDAVTRRVIIEATGTPAMLLPPTTFPLVDGTAVYPAQPGLQDKSDRRTGILSATRADQATYMLQRPGDVTLPGVDVGWWNAGKRSVERVHLDPVVLHVAINPAFKDQESAPPAGRPWRRAILFVLDHWPAILAGLAALTAVAWWAPPAARAMLRALTRRRDAYHASEAFAFSALRTAARSGDTRRTYQALLDWLARFAPIAPDRTIAAFRAAARDPSMDQEIERLEARLYGPRREEGAWAHRRFITRIGAARRKLMRRAQDGAATGPLPRTLNPTAAGERGSPLLRPVAR